MYDFLSIDLGGFNSQRDHFCADFIGEVLMLDAPIVVVPRHEQSLLFIYGRIDSHRYSRMIVVDDILDKPERYRSEDDELRHDNWLLNTGRPTYLISSLGDCETVNFSKIGFVVIALSADRFAPQTVEEVLPLTMDKLVQCGVEPQLESPFFLKPSQNIFDRLELNVFEKEADRV